MSEQEQQQQCKRCEGTKKVPCDRCRETGEVYGSVLYDQLFKCIKCDGTGLMECPSCKERKRPYLEDY